MIYLDNAATTRICDEALVAFEKFYKEEYFNPSAIYGGAIAVHREVEKARGVIAACLKVLPENVFFTASGSEGDNLAIFGSVGSLKSSGRIICSACEHPAVYNAISALKNRGYDVEFVPCNHDGTVNVEQYEKAISDGEVTFASIMHVNNETGGINDIAKLAEMLKAKNPDAVFHSDGVQAFMKKPIALKNTKIDLYSFSAHKINGPKGVGAIYAKNPNKLTPLIYGGGQESGIRSGTENTAGIIAFAIACEKWRKNGKNYLESFKKFREILLSELANVPDITYNTDVNTCSPHIVSLNLGGVKGEVLLHMLEEKGIYMGRGSACSTKNALPRALRALDVKGEGTIRVSFGIYNTEDEIKFFAKELKRAINDLRNIMKG